MFMADGLLLAASSEPVLSIFRGTFRLCDFGRYTRRCSHRTLPVISRAFLTAVSPQLRITSYSMFDVMAQYGHAYGKHGIAAYHISSLSALNHTRSSCLVLMET
jgi:hypothetical protein